MYKLINTQVTVWAMEPENAEFPREMDRGLGAVA